MLPRVLAALVIAAIVAGCVPPPPPDAWGAQAVAYVPAYGPSWVGTQTPSGRYQDSGSHRPFQTPNSLPLGAYTPPYL